jgi:hypothetical protein
LNAVYTHKTNTAVNLHLAFFSIRASSSLYSAIRKTGERRATELRHSSLSGLLYRKVSLKN